MSYKKDARRGDRKTRDLAQPAPRISGQHHAARFLERNLAKAANKSSTEIFSLLETEGGATPPITVENLDVHPPLYGNHSGAVANCAVSRIPRWPECLKPASRLKTAARRAHRAG
jgi:hypothetical protein